jgi:DNA-binding LacI/PurR family transcriptional regulator
VARATIIDVAKAAGVSRTTVSNVMNGKSKCSSETRENILKAARQLGYMRNMAAKTLVEQRSSLIGLVLPTYIDERLLTKSPFYNLIIDAVNSQLRETEDYDLIINCVSRNKMSTVLDWTMKRSLDGLILVGDFPSESLSELDSLRIPMVFIDSYRCELQSSIFVNTEDEAGGYMATRYLVNKGYSRIAICTSDIRGSAVNQQRRKGYRRALAESGLEESLFEAANNFFDGGVAIADEILARKADAVFVTNDSLATGIVNRLVALGIPIPEEFGVIGFDNLDICSQIVPELTTIDQDIFGKGKAAVKLLLEAIDNGLSPRRLILPTRIVSRQTA